MTATATTITVDSLPIASTIDPVQDRILIYTSSVTDIQGISRNVYLGLSSNPLGTTDSQSPQNKTFDNTNLLTIKATNLIIQDGTDTTKQAKFVASGITTGNTRNYTLPDYNATLASLAGTETLTNKTLTSPVVNTPTISSPTTTALSNSGGLTTDTLTITGVASVGGVLTPSGGLSANSVKSTALALSNVLDSTNGVKSYTNTNSGGGTGYYINLGGIKICWGLTGTFATSLATNYSISLPTSFFTTVQSSQVNVFNPTNAPTINAFVSATTSTLTMFINTANTNCQFQWFVIGT